jgi:hypothetical protein
MGFERRAAGLKISLGAATQRSNKGKAGGQGGAGAMAPMEPPVAALKGSWTSRTLFCSSGRWRHVVMPRSNRRRTPGDVFHVLNRAVAQLTIFEKAGSGGRWLAVRRL